MAIKGKTNPYSWQLWVSNAKLSDSFSYICLECSVLDPVKHMLCHYPYSANSSRSVSYGSLISQCLTPDSAGRWPSGNVHRTSERHPRGRLQLQPRWARWWVYIPCSLFFTPAQRSHHWRFVILSGRSSEWAFVSHKDTLYVTSQSCPWNMRGFFSAAPFASQKYNLEGRKMLFR